MIKETYKVIENTCHIPQIFSEAIAFATLGYLEEKIYSGEITEISFENTEWVDILPLLYMSVLIGNSLNNIQNITINLGKYTYKDSSPHSAFIVFFINEGFLDLFYKINTEKILFRINGKNVSAQEVVNLVVKYTSRVKKCFPPQCISTQTLFKINGENETFIEYIENIIKSIEISVSFATYGGTIAKERTLNKIRPVLQELIYNIYEHAYISTLKNSNKKSFFSVFIRMLTPDLDKNKIRQERDKKNIPHIEQLSKESGFPRVEIYIVDAGIGLKQYAERVSGKKITSVIDSLGVNLLQGDKDSYRISKNKTHIAGLKHIGKILMHERNYIRIFTECGILSLSCEEQPPQSPRLSKTIHFGKTDSPGMAQDVKKIMLETNKYPPSGTCYCISIPIFQESIEFSQDWYTPNDEEKRILFDSASNRVSQQQDEEQRIIFFDRLFNKEKIDYPNDESIKRLGLYTSRNKSDILIIRLPRHVSKDICTRWLDIIGNEKFSFSSVIFADVSPSFAKQLFSIIESKKIKSSHHINIRILTTSWNIASFSSIYGEHSFKINNTNEYSAKSFYSGNPSKALSVINFLINHDSKIFWEEVDEYLFYNGLVEVEKNIFVQGYLHFKEAISNKSRRAVCKLALRRFLSLLQIKEIIPVEPLVNSLSLELSLGFKEFSKVDGKRIGVVSVNATSSSFEQYSTEYEEKIDNYIACFQAPLENGSAAQGITYVLNWLPPQEITNQTEPQKRIKKTPYFLPKGKDSIELPHHIPASNFEKSPYGCLKIETYKQFSQLDCLRFQHTKNGSRHDLLSLNTVRAIESSFYNIFGPYSWLREELVDNLDKNDNIIIYPSHYATDIILDSLLSPDVERIGISFFSEKSNVPLRLSPSSSKKIIDCCNEFKSVIIFDDGVITGSHIRFLVDYIQYACSVKKENIKTISIVDRTRTPIDCEVVLKKIENDLRYWRHDVPVFSEEHSCLFCFSLQKLAEVTSKIPCKIKVIIEKKWIPCWQVKDIYPEWGANGLSPTIFEISPVSVIFGKDKISGDNHINIDTSTTLLSYITEITQLLPGKLLGIEKGEIFKDTQPKVAIELVAGEFFLSFHELSPRAKERSLKFLFNIIINLTKNEDECTYKYASLATLCFLAVEKSIFNSVWNNNIVPFINSKHIEWSESLKSVLCVFYYYSGTKNIFITSHTDYKNLVSTGMIPELFLYTESLLSTIGVRRGKFHKREITQGVNKLKDLLEGDVTYICHILLTKILHQIEIYNDKFSNSICYYPRMESKIRKEIQKFKENYCKILEIIKNIPFQTCIESNKEKCAVSQCCKNQTLNIDKNVKPLIVEIVDCFDSTTEIIFNNFIFLLKKGESKSFFLEKIVDECLLDLKKDGIQLNVGYPLVSWVTDYYAIISDEIFFLVKNIICNTRNHSEEIINTHYPDTYEAMCSFFWNAEIITEGTQDFLQISFTNKAEKEPSPTFGTRETANLHEQGGSIFTNYLENSKLFTVTIKLRAFKA